MSQEMLELINVASNFLKWEMVDEKTVTSQVSESKKFVNEALYEGSEMNEAFEVVYLIVKLPLPCKH